MLDRFRNWCQVTEEMNSTLENRRIFFAVNLNAEAQSGLLPYGEALMVARAKDCLVTHNGVAGYFTSTDHRFVDIGTINLIKSIRKANQKPSGGHHD